MNNTEQYVPGFRTNNVSKIFVLTAWLLSTAGLIVPLRSQAEVGKPEKRLLRRLDGSALPAARADVIADKELKDDSVMGAQLAILNGGRVVWTHVWGLRDREKKLPMTPDSNIWAASLTKGVFASWVMRLAEQHRVDLDQPVSRMLPRPLNEYVPYRESATALVLDPQWQQVTPRILLSHSSGLANFALYGEPDAKLHLHSKPGTRFAYSGEGFNLLQFVLEETLHEPLDVAMQRDFFAPLGMSRTGMIWRSDFAADTALRYGANGKYLDTTHRDHPRGAGSMATTITDLTRFTEALLANEILHPTTRARMLTPQIKIDAAHQFPTMATDASSEGPRVGLAYGMGWGLLTRTKFGPAFFKEGHGDGGENYMICFTKSGTCMIMLTNSDNGELAFRPLLEHLIGDTVTPWEFEGYTRENIIHNQEHSAPK